MFTCVPDNAYNTIGLEAADLIISHLKYKKAQGVVCDKNM